MDNTYHNDIRFQTVKSEARVPQKKRKGDAGYDLYTIRDYNIAPGQIVQMWTGIKVMLPARTMGLIQERSSQSLKGLITVGNVIDEGYRGEISVIVLNTSSQHRQIGKWERVAQLVVLERHVSSHEDSLPERGTQGFGSTQDTLKEVPQ